MTTFDESKIRRDGEGKFASKGPAAEADGVDLDAGTGSDSSHPPLDEMEPRDAYVQMVRELATYDPDEVSVRYGIGMSEEHKALYQAAADGTRSPEEDESLYDTAREALYADPNDWSGARELDHALGAYDADGDARALADASMSYLRKFERGEVDVDEAAEMAGEDWDAGEDDPDHIPMFSDRFSEVTRHGNPYTRISNDESEAPFVSRGEVGDDSVDDEFTTVRTWATGDPEHPFVSAIKTTYVSPWEAQADPAELKSWQESRAELEDADVEYTRLLREAEMGDADDERAAEVEQRLTELESQMAALRTRPEPQFEVTGMMSPDDYDDHVYAHAQAGQSRQHARFLETSMSNLPQRDQAKAKADMERSRRYARGLEEENPSRVRFKVRSKTQISAHTVEDNPLGSAVASEVSQDADAEVFHDSVYAARDEARRTAERFDFDRGVSIKDWLSKQR